MLRKSYLKGLNWEIVSHLLYSLSIVLSDRYLFRSMNNILADQSFQVWGVGMQMQGYVSRQICRHRNSDKGG